MCSPGWKHPGYGPPDLQERICLGPQEQLVSLHDPLVSPQRHPEGKLAVSWTEHTATPPHPGHTNKGRPILYRTIQVNNQIKGEEGKEGEEEALDLGVHMDARGHESLHAPGPHV